MNCCAGLFLPASNTVCAEGKGVSGFTISLRGFRTDALRAFLPFSLEFVDGSETIFLLR